MNLKEHIDLVGSIAPVGDRTATVNGASVDLAGFNDQPLVLFHAGTITDGTHTPSLEESDDDSSWSAVAAADMEGTLAALATDTDQKVGYKGTKRYLRPTVTVTGGPVTGGQYSAAIALGGARKGPVS